ncbi:MAG: thiamine diphosphokinase [Roseobacter sp.]
MKTPILNSSDPLTLIGGGEATPEDLKEALVFAPQCIAADSGAHLALETGVELAAVIGDFDSISDAARAQVASDRLHRIAEQNSTDFDKALRNVSAPVVVALGFLGGQIDHELASLHTLVMRCDRAIVLLGKSDIVFLCPPSLKLPLPKETRVSLFPMGVVRGRSNGLHWPIDDIEFQPGVRSGTSNKATGDVLLEVDAPLMLCILPRAFIQPVVSLLSQLPETARWPARAG